jgi:hypothetical protein
LGAFFPGAQFKQSLSEEEPSFWWYFPKGQPVHLLEPSDSSYLPFGQSSQEDAPKVELNFPAAQSEHVATLTAPGAPLYFPAVQEVQVDSLEAPTEELNFPAEHSSQLMASSVELYFPAAQSTQDANPGELYFPAVQDVQVDSLDAPTEELNFPALQSEQADAPVDVLYFPTVQSEQEIAPTVLNFPAEQGPWQSKLEAPPDGL